MTNQEKWVGFCAEHDREICLYDKPFWLDAVCGGRGNWDVFLVEEKDEITAALPYYQKKRMGLTYITQPKLTQRNGIWLKAIEGEKTEKRIHREYRAYKLLIEQIEKTGVSIYQQCFSPAVKNWQPFYWQGYKQKTLYTFCIDSPGDLTNAEANFNQSARSNLRKALQAGTFAEFDDIGLFYQVNSMTFARQGLKNPVPFPLLERLYRACKENDAVKMFCARDPEGVVCSVALFVYDAANVYALMSGSDPTKRHNNYHTVLAYEGIKFACETGRKMDFEGSMIEGVAHSIVGFGAEMCPYYSIRKVFLKTPILSHYLKYRLYR